MSSSTLGVASHNSGIVSWFKKYNDKEMTTPMKKIAMTALGLGAAYLMRNKDARDKLLKQFESLAPKNSMQKNS